MPFSADRYIILASASLTGYTFSRFPSQSCFILIDDITDAQNFTQCRVPVTYLPIYQLNFVETKYRRGNVPTLSSKKIEIIYHQSEKIDKYDKKLRIRWYEQKKKMK